MWSTQMWFYQLSLTIVLFRRAIGNPVASTFNANLRDYSVKEDGVNATARTLQQEELGRYANFAPVSNPIRFKEIPDNALSSSTYSRGLAHHDHGIGGYGLHDYDDNHYGYGYEFAHHGGFEHHPGPHGYHLGHGHHGHHGHHHKHYDHALAAKTILWPLAGLAILGTAAALVSNPVLLQLGVISGRKRRDTQEVSTELDFQNWKTDVAGVKEPTDRHSKWKKDDKRGFKKRVFNVKQGGLKKAYPTSQSAIESVTLDAPLYNGHIDEDRLIPIPLRTKKH